MMLQERTAASVFIGHSSPAMPPLLVLAPLPDFLADPLRARFEFLEYHNAPDKAALLREHGARVRAVVGAGGTNYSVDILDQLPAVEIISVFGVGYDGVPLDYCRARGIRVTNTPDVLTDEVADTAVALVLMTSRKLIAANRYLHAGKWPSGNFELSTSLREKVVGIFGLGRIGKAIAHRLEAFGMCIAYHGRSEQDVDYLYHDSLASLAAGSHFLIVACPGGEATKHLVNRDILEALGSDGTLINIARGSVVDEAALIAALQNHTIKAAGIDVFANEPNVPAALIQCENAVLLPHVGSATHETRGAMAQLVVENLKAHFAGEALLNPVV